MRRIALTSLAVQTLLVLALLYASAAHARAPYLADATRPPSALALLAPGQSITYAHGRVGWQCRRGTEGYYFSDVQAYTWYGAPLHSQRWNGAGDVTYWRSVHHRVTFDGLTFRNRTRGSVLVAGWCAQ